MYGRDLNQPEFEDFYLPFGGHLKSDNRWVTLAKLIPWKDIEALYSKNFSSNGMGALAKSARIALGALIIKERLGSSDEETVEQITENPYLQYFLGLSEYSNKTLFDASMFVHFRKRLSWNNYNESEDLIHQINSYKKRFGYYPESVHTDQIYRNRNVTSQKGTTICHCATRRVAPTKSAPISERRINAKKAGS